MTRFVGITAALAQLTMVLASGADAWRGRDASAHVERSGTHLHYAHDEATCVACTTQTLHAQVAPPAVDLPVSPVRQSANLDPAAVLPRSDTYTPDAARAPPRMS